MSQQGQKPDILTEIQVCFGEKARKYAANKHRGGVNGKKGSRYEDFYMAFKAAEWAARCFRHLIPAWPRLRGQIVGFVDDFAIDLAENTEYYQLKNVGSLTWDGGDHPLVEDFARQYKLAVHLGEPSPTTNLVVSGGKVATEMVETL